MSPADEGDFQHHDDHEDDHFHIPLWILSLIGGLVATLILLPNGLSILKSRRAVNEKID